VRLARWPSDPPIELYPGACYVLISLADRNAPVVRAFRISASGQITEEELEQV
jgi:hypothetical protein